MGVSTIPLSYTRLEQHMPTVSKSQVPQDAKEHAQSLQDALITDTLNNELTNKQLKDKRKYAKRKQKREALRDIMGEPEDLRIKPIKVYQRS